MKKVEHHFNLTGVPFIAGRILHNYKRDRSYFEHYSPIFNNKFLVSFEEKLEHLVHFIPNLTFDKGIVKPDEKIEVIIVCFGPLLEVAEAFLHSVPKASILPEMGINFNGLREALGRRCIAEIKGICIEIVSRFELHIEKFIDKGILSIILNDFRILIVKLKELDSELSNFARQSDMASDINLLDDNQLEDFVETIIASTPAVFGGQDISKREDYSIEKIMMQAQFRKSDRQ
jgi:hypothetical protein